MELLQSWFDQYLLPFLPSLLIVALVFLITHWRMRRNESEIQGYRFRDQLLVVLAVVAGLVGVLLTLPIGGDTRGQLLTLLGLLLTAIITLSSPTIAANAMAGIMIRSFGNFKPGDFIQVGDYFGRVTEQDLFHTEIQTENRDLLTIPNLYLSSQPVKVVHASGTIVSAEVSLGYDIDHHLVEALLLQAAINAGLEDPFVYVMELGDYSVVYRVNGFLTEIKTLLSARSQLRRKMMDMIHDHDIEIASPSIMLQKPLKDDLIPERAFVSRISKGAGFSPETLVFDKAERAEQIEGLRAAYEELKEELNNSDAKESDDSESNESRGKKIRRLKAMKRALRMLERQKKD